jgi:hypothetical protein
MSNLTFRNKLNYENLDSITLKHDKVREKYVHDLVLNEAEIQNDIMSILELKDKSKLKLIHEDTYINGITADFTLIYDDSISAIIECKAGDIGVTDYVRGIGQVLQYEYFYEEKISKNIPYSKNFKTILLFPSSVIKNNLLNIGRFKYPHSTIIIEINESSKVTRTISEDELHKLGQALDNNLTTISQYYIRDNRLFELYLLLKYLMFLNIKGSYKVNRKKLEEIDLKKLQTPNNRNWRNAFISLSSLGFINSKNLPTPSGVRISALSYEDFLLMMYKSYIKPYVDELLNYFIKEKNGLLKTNQQICNDLRIIFLNKDVLFLTQSDGRYMSSWLNILRDDFGCLDFVARSSKRKLLYNINELNDDAIIKNIKKHSKAYKYLNNFESLISS